MVISPNTLCPTPKWVKHSLLYVLLLKYCYILTNSVTKLKKSGNEMAGLITKNYAKQAPNTSAFSLSFVTKFTTPLRINLTFSSAFHFIVLHLPH